MLIALPLPEDHSVTAPSLQVALGQPSPPCQRTAPLRGHPHKTHHAPVPHAIPSLVPRASETSIVAVGDGPEPGPVLFHRVFLILKFSDRFLTTLST